MGSDSRVCREVLDVSRRISRWLYRQPAVGEESITDWMLYEVSERLPFAVYVKFTRAKEARESGADWDWWFVSRSLSLGLRFQAKRLSRKVDHYAALAYTNQYGLQIEKLIESSREMNLLPFYALYHATAAPPPLRFNHSDKAGMHEGVFLASAAELFGRFINGPRVNVDPTDLLQMTTPLSGMFCCDSRRHQSIPPVESLYGYLTEYYQAAIEAARHGDNERPGLHREVPRYVSALLETDRRRLHERREEEKHYPTRDVRALVIFNLDGY